MEEDGWLDFPVFVINLERNQNRRTYITKHLNALGINPTIVPAVDGRKLDYEELKKSGVYDDSVAHEVFSRSLSLPEIGCLLSHRNIYEEIIKNGFEQALVLEDDVIFTDGAVEILRNLLDELPDDCDVVQLYYSCKDYDRIGENLVRFNFNDCMPVGAAGYIVKLSGAKKLLDEWYPARYPADSYIGRSYRWGTIVYGSRPSLMRQSILFPTDIESRDNLLSELRFYIKKMIVKVLSVFS